MCESSGYQRAQYAICGLKLIKVWVFYIIRLKAFRDFGCIVQIIYWPIIRGIIAIRIKCLSTSVTTACGKYTLV